MSDAAYEQARRKIDAALRTGATTLYLRGNGLTALPPEIARLTALRSLDLGGNGLTALPPEIARLTALQHLYLRDNRLTALPRALGQLVSLAQAAERDTEPFTEGLSVEGNPLPPPYPQLIANGQPSATRNVLAYLRGDLHVEILTTPPVDSPEQTPTPNPPELPPQTTGPHFALDANGTIGFAPLEALDRLGNNLARLRALHPVLRELVRDLVQALGEGNAPHPSLQRRAAAYADLINQALEGLDFARLYAEGVRLAIAAQATAARIADPSSGLPSLGLDAQEALDSLLTLHGTFVLSTAAGMAAIETEERYDRNPQEERAYRAAAGDVAAAFKAHPEIMRPDAADTVQGAAEATGLGSHPERSAVIGFGILNNATTTLAGGALVGSALTGLMPGLGEATLWAGAGGVALAGWIGVLAVTEAVKKSAFFAAVVERIKSGIDTTLPHPDAATARVIEGMSRHASFLFSNEGLFRRLAKSSARFAWLDGVLDWLKTQEGMGGRP